MNLADTGSSPVVQPNFGEVAELVNGARLLSGRGSSSHQGSNPCLSASQQLSVAKQDKAPGFEPGDLQVRVLPGRPFIAYLFGALVGGEMALIVFGGLSRGHEHEPATRDIGEPI